MRSTSHEGIVVEVEDPAWFVRVRLKKHRWRHHRSRGNVIAEGLKLEATILEELVYAHANADVVRIYVTPSLDQQIAKPEIVGLHGRVVTGPKGAQVSLAQGMTDEVLGGTFIEKPMPDSSCPPRSPGLDAFFYIPRQLPQVVPELDNHSGRRILVLITNRGLWLALLNQPSNELRASLVMLWTVGFVRHRNPPSYGEEIPRKR
jgi:hypothetical protein